MWALLFLRFEAKRVIIRQGHKAAFCLGQVIKLTLLDLLRLLTRQIFLQSPQRGREDNIAQPIQMTAEKESYKEKKYWLIWHRGGKPPESLRGLGSSIFYSNSFLSTPRGIIGYQRRETWSNAGGEGEEISSINTLLLKLREALEWLPPPHPHTPSPLPKKKRKKENRALTLIVQLFCSTRYAISQRCEVQKTEKHNSCCSRERKQLWGT